MLTGFLKAWGQHRNWPSGDQPSLRKSVFCEVRWKGSSTRAASFQSRASQRTAERSSPCEAMYRPLVRCVELDPNDASAHYSLGAVLHARGNCPAAEKHYRKVIQLEPHARAEVAREVVQVLALLARENRRGHQKHVSMARK